jgi:hypothetical protein
MRIDDRAEDWLPRRPRLRPGLRAVRRDSRHLQVGLDPAERLVLPDTESSRRILADLETTRRPVLDEPGAREWCRALVARGLVVDADAVELALRGPLPRSAVLAAFATGGPSASARLAARSEARAAVVAAEPWRRAAVRAMSAAGLTVAGPGDRVVAHLLVDPDEELLDELVRASAPHLVMTGVAGRITLGPFVSPGRTACCRCVIAHRCDRDPGHATVREQQAAGPEHVVPADPLLVQLAAAWAVRDLVSYVEGDLPATWSSTIAVDPGLALSPQRWLRHPGCGCSWGDELAAG